MHAYMHALLLILGLFLPLLRRVRICRPLATSTTLGGTSLFSKGRPILKVLASLAPLDLHFRRLDDPDF